MARAGQICAHPGCPEIAVYRGRCGGHASEYEREQKLSVPTKRDERSSRGRRADAVRKHRKTYGDWCPGYGRPPHVATDLTAQHSHALVLDGARGQELTVLCRSCNSRHGVEMRRRKDRLV